MIIYPAAAIRMVEDVSRKSFISFRVYSPIRQAAVKYWAKPMMTRLPKRVSFRSDSSKVDFFCFLRIPSGLYFDNLSAKVRKKKSSKGNYSRLLFFLTIILVKISEMAPPTIIITVCQPWKINVNATASFLGML